MNRFRFCLLLTLLSLAASAGVAAGVTIKVLTIGNSFADNATTYLARIAASQGVEFVVGKANLGGSDLGRHVRHLEAYERDPVGPEGRPYRDARKAGREGISLVELLDSDTWDFVTIQQLSSKSFDPGSYEPAAGKLIATVRKHAPGAEILVHQTWAYREDHAWFNGGSDPTHPDSQAAMYARLTDAYERLASRHGLRILPVGDGFQLARQSSRWRFRYPDPDFNYEAPAPGSRPRQEGSLNVGWLWRKNREAGATKLVLDANHANEEGCYLGGCIWFEVLAGRPLTEPVWHPDALSVEQARSLQQFAHEAVVRRGSIQPGLRPYAANSRYWQYRGQPVLLLGGSKDDNLFQIPDLTAHLDAIKAAGGNYVRNTMSDRPDGGFEVAAFGRGPDGRFDLTTWNEVYWSRLEEFLKGTAERGIFVQIELWDRFDHSRRPWETDPFNPGNNVNYTYHQSGFDPHYPEHPGRNLQPFFFTTPAQQNNQIVLPYQQAFIRRLLSMTLCYDHVLYCIDNETRAQDEWATYWADFVQGEAAARGMAVEVTEMWDERDPRNEVHRRTLDHPERYGFIDISQINHAENDEHWARLQWTRSYLAASPRPINLVKNYGAEGSKHGRSANSAIGRFVRAVIGGAAAVRFHRPPSGLGLSAPAVAAIQAVRKLESRIPLWSLEPALALLNDRAEGEAYLATDVAHAYALFYPNGGNVGLDLRGHPGTYRIEWIDVNTGQWGATCLVTGDEWVPLAAPGPGPWLAAIKRVEEATATVSIRDESAVPSLTAAAASVQLSAAHWMGSGGTSWVDTDSAGNVHVVFEGQYRRGSTVAKMGPVETISAHRGNDFMNPKIDVDATGVPHIVYQKGKTSDAESCFYLTRRNGTWIEPEKFAYRSEINPPTRRMMMPDVCADAQGRVLACAWASRNVGPLQGAVYRWRDIDGKWSDYDGGLSADHAASPKVEERNNRFYLHYAKGDYEKMLVGPVAFGTKITKAKVDFGSRDIGRSFQNEGTNFKITSTGVVIAAGNFRKTPAGGGIGLWFADNASGSFSARIIAELDGVPPEGKEEGHQQPDLVLDEATGDCYVTYYYAVDHKAYFQVRKAGTWSEPIPLYPEGDGVQGYFRCGPSVADIPGPGVVVCVNNDGEVYLRTIGVPVVTK